MAQVVLTQGADIYSLGCLAFSLYTGRLLINNVETVKKIFKGQSPASKMRADLASIIHSRVEKYIDRAGCAAHDVGKSFVLKCTAWGNERAKFPELQQLFVAGSKETPLQHICL